MDKALALDVRIESKIYRDFMVFDNLTRIGAWRRPLWFAAIFTGLAAVALVATMFGYQGLVLGLALLVVGLGLPGLLIARIYYVIGTRVRGLGLAKGKSRLAYHLDFTKDKNALVVSVPGKEALVFPWAQAMGAWRRMEAIYVYVQPGRAYLVPAGQAEGGLDQYWDYLRNVLPGERLHGK